MRGLIIKDYYCMKSSMQRILLVFIATVFLAVMFTLSARYGNIAKSVTSLGTEYESDFFAAYRCAIWIFLLIPMAQATEIMNCFIKDNQAGFWKTACSLPVSEWEIAGARYVAAVLYAFAGAVDSLVSAACMSAASGELVFAELVSVILTFLGAMLILLAIGIPLVYGLGAKYSDIVIVCLSFTAVFGVIFYVLMRIREIAKTIEVTERMEDLLQMLNKVNDFLTSKGPAVLLVAVLICGVSFPLSVWILKRRGGAAA